MTIAPNWRSGTTMTLEEYRRHEEPVPPPPARGSRLTELAAALGDRPGWQDKAACKGKPTEWWFPASGAYNKDTQRAVAICATCPVIEPCRKTGVENNERGLWGDTTGTQRTNIRVSNTRNYERKFGPVSTRVLEIISDGRWHSYDELTDACADLIPPETAMHRITVERHRQARRTGRVDMPAVRFTPGAVAAGRRGIIADSINSLHKARRVQRSRGNVRLVQT